MFEGLGLEEVDKVFCNFDTRVPHGEELFMVLKAHLIIEQALVEFVKIRVANIDFNEGDEGFICNNSPCRNGLGLILLAQGLSLRDEAPQSYANIIWPALKLLNSTRNSLAHELDPNSIKLKKKMTKFIELFREDMPTTELDVNKAFRSCAGLLVVYLHLDKQPFLTSDIDWGNLDSENLI